VALLAACDAEQARVKPEAPDMTALVSAYAVPSRAFDEAAALDIQARVEQEVKQLIDASGLVDVLEQAVVSLGADPAPTARTGPIVLEGEGFAKVTRICRGHGTPAPPVGDANGRVELTVGYTQQGLDPVVFGGATMSKEELSGAALELDGDVNLFIGNNLMADMLPASPIIFELANARLSVNGTELINGGFDFQVCRGNAVLCVPNTFEISIGLPGETNLVMFLDLGTKTGGFRAANGVWACDFINGSCSDGANTVVIPAYQL
jgi:hypothetical protein